MASANFFFIFALYRLMSYIQTSSISVKLKRSSPFELPKPLQFSKLTQQPSSLQTNNLAQIRKSLTNYQDLQYYGLLLIGTSQKEMSFVFDTGSNQLWFPTSECASCHSSNLYDTSSSTAYKRTSNTLQQIQYGKGEVRGYPSQDQVYFTITAAVPQMPLLAVTEEKDFEGTQADGILGLAPLNQENQPPYLLDILHDNGLITGKVLSFILHYQDKQSTVIFGDPDYTLAVEFSKNATISLYDKGVLYFVELSTATIDGDSIELSSTPALFDTGTSLLVMPSAALRTLIEYYISQGVSIQYSQGLFTAQCNQLPVQPLQLRIGEYIFQVPYEKFWQKVALYSCFLMVQEGPFWILGDVFLRDYYVVIDYDKGTISVYGAGIRHTNDPSPQPRPQPSGLKSSDSYLAAGWIVLIVLAYAVVAIGAAFLLEFCSQKKLTEMRGQQQYQQPLEMGRTSLEMK